MPRMSVPELEQIIETRMQTLRMSMEPKIADRIVKLAQGLPGYVHLLGQLAARNAINRQSQFVDLRDLKVAVATALDEAEEIDTRGVL